MNHTLQRYWHRLAAVAGCTLITAIAFAQEAGEHEAPPSGVLGSLGLNPRTVIVQALAFLILLWVLKKVLWGPILKIVAERQAEVAHTYSEAEGAQAAAEAARKDYEARLAQADEESRQRVAAALAEANRMKDDIMADARRQSERIIASGRESVRQEMEKAQVQIREASTRMAVDLAGRIIQQNITPESQRALIDRFIEGAGNAQ